MSRSNPNFVDDDTPTLEFEVPDRAGRTEGESGGDDPAHGDVIAADEAAAILLEGASPRGVGKE
jgi:hypothetical protein